MADTKEKISTKKQKKSEKNLKNVITLPYDKYWPLVENEDISKLNLLLEKSLMQLSFNNKVPRNLLEGKTTEERKQMKQTQKEELEATEQFKQAAKLRSQLLLGVNAVAKGLQKGTVAACLVSGDAKPVMLVSHLLHGAAVTRVPVVVVPTLRDISRNVMGFSCIALGFKKVTDEDWNLQELVQEITRLSSGFELPASLQLLSTPQMDPIPEVEPKDIPEEPIEYLKRPGPGRRAFIPGGKPRPQAKDFISLGDSGVSMEVEPSAVPYRQSKKAAYRPLIFNKVRPNPEKLKLKLNKSKKKSKK